MTDAEPTPTTGPDGPNPGAGFGRRLRLGRLRPRRPTANPLRTVRSRAAKVRARSRLTWFAAILLGGGLVGYVASAMGASLVDGGSLTGRPSEPVEARAYISALLNGDVNQLTQLRPPADLGKRAAAIQQSTLTQRWTPEAVSYLGGAVQGPVGVYVYVLNVRSPDGSMDQSVPFALTVVDKKVVRVQ